MQLKVKSNSQLKSKDGANYKSRLGSFQQFCARGKHKHHIQFGILGEATESGQVSAWQSGALLPVPISCKLVQPVPTWVEKPVSPVKHSSSGGATNNPPFPKMP